MARIYAGELTKIDREVVKRLRERLPDDFTVLAEVNVGRNVDLVVIRPNGDGAALIIAAELKHVSRPLMGQTDGVWKELADGGEWVEVTPSNNRDINHYAQAVNAANALKDWLWRNQRLFRGDPQAADRDPFSVWPDLVLLTEGTLVHRLPMAPANRFGLLFFELDAWIDHVLSWIPRKSLPLNQDEVERLVDAMGLVELPAPDAGPEATTALRPLPDVPGNDLAIMVRDLRDRVQVLETAVLRPRTAATLVGVARAS